MLWFGWFGFNAGSALSASYVASLAFTNTQLSAACAMVTWNVLEIVFSKHGLFKGRATAVGAASGVLCGLVGITPACGYVDPMWALFFGFFTSLGVFFVPEVMRKLGADDRLDAFGFHGVGGAIGSALTGLFANGMYSGTDPINVLGAATVNNGAGPAPYGSFYGNAVLLGKQCAAISVTILFAAVGTSIIFWVRCARRAHARARALGRRGNAQGTRAIADLPRARAPLHPLRLAPASTSAGRVGHWLGMWRVYPHRAAQARQGRREAASHRRLLAPRPPQHALLSVARRHALAVARHSPQCED